MTLQILSLKAALIAADLGVWMINIHSSGGSKYDGQSMKEIKDNNIEH